MNQNAAREGVNPGGEERNKRTRNPTPKGLASKCDILCERRNKINGRLITKYATIEDLLFLTGNLIQHLK